MKQRQTIEFSEFIRPDDRLLSLRNFSFHINRYAFASQFVKDRVTLDIACGSGYGARYLYSKGARKVVGGDVSQEAVELGRRFFKTENIEFILCDAVQLPFRDNSFDAIISLETIEHLKKYEAFLSECSRILKAGGFFICSTPNREARYLENEKPSYHYKEFAVNELVNLLLSADFENVNCYGQGFASKSKKGKYRLTDKLAYFIKGKIASVPTADKIVNLITRFILHDYRTVKLENANLDSYVNETYWPSPFKANSLSVPEGIVVVASKV